MPKSITVAIAPMTPNLASSWTRCRQRAYRVVRMLIRGQTLSFLRCTPRPGGGAVRWTGDTAPAYPMEDSCKRGRRGLRRFVMPRGRPAAQLGRDERVQVAVEHGLDVSCLDTGAMVLDHLVGVQHVGADLVAEGDLAAVAAQRRQLRLPLVAGPLGQPRREGLQRDRLVGQLGALVLHRDHDADGQVGDAHRRVGGVDALPAWP